MSPSFDLEAREILDSDKIQKLTDNFRNMFEDYVDRDLVSELMCAATLAHHGLLGSVKMMALFDVDLSPVPAQHLASLASCVTGKL